MITVNIGMMLNLIKVTVVLTEWQSDKVTEVLLVPKSGPVRKFVPTMSDKNFFNKSM